jgi:hypothetical protein
MLPWFPAASTPPALSSWTLIDPSGTGVFADTTNGVVAHAVTASSVITGLVVAAPGAPFTLTAHLTGAISPQQYRQWGVLVGDGTKFEHFGQVAIGGVSLVPQSNMIGAWTNSSTSTADRLAPSAANILFGFDGWYRIQYDGANLIFSISASGTPSTFNAIYSEAYNAFLSTAPTQIGFMANNGTAASGPTMLVELVYWKVTTP